MQISDQTPGSQNKPSAILHSILRFPVMVFSGFLLPVARDLWHVGCAICHPVTRGFARMTATIIRNLHNKKHWMSRFGATFWGNAIGLCIAMISAQLLSNFVEVPGAENLWGLFSDRTLLSENSYRVVSFIAEFMVTLIVFSAVEYIIDMRKQNKQNVIEEDEEL